MGEHFKKQLTEEMSSMGIALSEEQVRQFETYYDLLIEWNNVMNLTAITEESEVITKHFTDSASLIKAVPSILNAFLNEVTEKLGLTGITAVHGRAEDIGQNLQYREQFDMCVSRAVANMATLSEYCLPLVKQGGRFIAYKSEKAEEELRGAEGAIRKLGGEVKDICSFRLPNSDERKLVLVEKTKATPKKYPRKAGTPAKEPLC